MSPQLASYLILLDFLDPELYCVCGQFLEDETMLQQPGLVCGFLVGVSFGVKFHLSAFLGAEISCFRVLL